VILRLIGVYISFRRRKVKWSLELADIDMVINDG